MDNFKAVIDNKIKISVQQVPCGRINVHETVFLVEDLIK